MSRDSSELLGSPEGAKLQATALPAACGLHGGEGRARSLKFCLEGTQLPGSLEAGLQHLLPSTHLSKASLSHNWAPRSRA